jgi:hypothetical protein
MKEELNTPFIYSFAPKYIKLYIGTDVQWLETEINE